MIKRTIAQNQKRGSSSSNSPQRGIRRLGGTPPKAHSPLKPQAVYQHQQHQQLSKSYSPLKSDGPIISREFKQASDQNQKLRQHLYCLLADLPDYITTKSLGISKYERDQTIAQTSQRLGRIALNQDLIVRYQTISQKLKEQLKTIKSIRGINQKMEDSLSSTILNKQL